jgi:hypothetical protein
MTKEYTYRFKCWAAAISKTPETALKRDEDGVPLNLYVFSLWIQDHWSKWRKLNGVKQYDPISEEDHRQFDIWLAKKVGLKTI